MESYRWYQCYGSRRAKKGEPSWALLCATYSLNLFPTQDQKSSNSSLLAVHSGSAEELAKSAFCRVAYNLHWLRQQTVETRPGPGMDRYTQLTQGAAYVHIHMAQLSSALCSAFRAHAGCVTLFVDVMCHMLALRDLLAQLVLFCISIQIILLQTTEVQPYSRYLELLETPFLDCITRAGMMTRNYPAQLQPIVQAFSSGCVDLLLNMECFCVYSPFFPGSTGASKPLRHL